MERIIDGYIINSYDSGVCKCDLCGKVGGKCYSTKKGLYWYPIKGRYCNDKCFIKHHKAEGSVNHDNGGESAG